MNNKNITSKNYINYNNNNSFNIKDNLQNSEEDYFSYNIMINKFKDRYRPKKRYNKWWRWFDCNVNQIKMKQKENRLKEKRLKVIFKTQSIKRM